MQTDVTDKLLLNVAEAAKALSVCPKTLWNKTEPRGSIPVMRIGTRTLYPVDGLRKWIASQSNGVACGCQKGGCCDAK